MESRPRKLLDHVRDAIRLKHYSYRTEQTYVGWIRRYIIFHNKQHPKDMGVAEVEAFLTHLAVEGHVSASTQNQALSGLLFLYRTVLNQEWGQLEAIRAKRSRYLPTVLSNHEVRSILHHGSGVAGLVLKVLYGSGLRLSEGLSLRVKDIDFAQRQIVVRDTKGNESRITMLPGSLIEHIRTVQELLGHKDVKTTMIYTYVLNRGGRGVRSPLDWDIKRLYL
jgi:site-specific recombinase XerD